MGCGLSTSDDQFGSHSAPAETPVPEDPVPYPGPKGRYHIIKCRVDVTPTLTFGLGPTAVTSNIDTHYQTLSQPYAEGFKLISFYCIPYSVKRKAFSATLNYPYYGMYFQSQKPSNERWQLTVIKSQMEVQNVSGLLKSELRGRTEKITTAIADMANRGGRLVCIENTQKRLAQTMKRAFSGFGPVQGVDVFVEMPLHPNPTIYTYTAVNVPMKLHTAGFQSVSVTCDWNHIFGQYLDTGWRLTEIYLDQGMAHRAFSTSAKMNSVWFFEKESALLEDNRPRYQGTIIYYELKSSAQSGNLVANTENWGGLLSAMGEKGWELACILDIPQTRTGFLNLHTTLLFFFQRELISSGTVFL